MSEQPGGLERFDAAWLFLRETADAAARAEELQEPLRAYLVGLSADDGRPVGVLDLGSGTGSTLRWLAPLLPGPQRWVLLDHDAELLAYAQERATAVPDASGDRVEVSTRTLDLTALRVADLRATTVVTASALLDLLTREEITTLAAVCAAAGCAAYVTLSVAGHVRLNPADPLDEVVAAAFDAHQRRLRDGRALLGPDAVDVAVAALESHGFYVRTAASPWRLGASDGPLLRAWLDGWLGAAADQRPDLAAELTAYGERRSEQITAGELRAEVHHVDLLALPR